MKEVALRIGDPSHYAQEDMAATVSESTGFVWQDFEEEVDLEIWVTPWKDTEGFYRTRASSDAGYVCEGVVLLKSEDPDIQCILRKIEAEETHELLLQALGARLFGALFNGKVGDAYQRCCGRVGIHGKLRLRLWIDPPEISALPWEYLFDPFDDTFVSVSHRHVLTRYIGVSKPVGSLTVEKPLRILLSASSPKDMLPLDVGREIGQVSKELAELEKQGHIKLDKLEHTSRGGIRQKLRSREPPHVFHFIGHGAFAHGTGCVFLEHEETQYRDEVGDRGFAGFFNPGHTRLVVLNACKSGKVDSMHSMVGMAPHLMRKGLLAVVAMRYELADVIAIKFSKEFYGSLAAGYPVDAAISEARRTIYQDCGPDRRDWGTPVLFMRSTDGRLFH